MFVNNLDHQIATYIGTAKSQNLILSGPRQAMWKDNLSIRNVHNLRGTKEKGMETFIQMSPNPTNGININKNIKGKQKEADQPLTLQEREEKKCSLIFKTYLISLWV